MTQIKIIRETLMAADYRLYDTSQSRIDPRVTTRREIGWSCPLCRREVRGSVLEYGKTRHCRACGLFLTTSGNWLECEIDSKRLQNYEKAGHKTV